MHGMRVGAAGAVRGIALSVEDFEAIAGGRRWLVEKEAMALLKERADRFELLVRQGKRVYGVSTGYGAESVRTVPTEERHEFQLETLRRSTWGTGRSMSRSEARGAWIAKVLSLLHGNTGARADVVSVILALLNAGLAPVIPERGSLCASGDLIPSAHLAMPLIGEGWVTRDEAQELPARDALQLAGVEPIKLGPRDGLSLVNGTAVTTSLAAHVCTAAKRALLSAGWVVAAGLDVRGGHVAAFAGAVTDVRPQRGSASTSELVRKGLEGCDEARLGSRGVHDPYGWRCVPQVHGAAESALNWAVETVTTELASCTDNPIVGEDGTIYSGGNFHGAPLGITMDALRLALMEVAGLSRQRLAALASMEVDRNDRLSLDMLLTSATATLLESSSSGVATGHWLPIDSIEDHVSNATLAARRARESVEALTSLLAAESIAISALSVSDGSAYSSRAARWLRSVVSAINGREVDVLCGGDGKLMEALAGALSRGPEGVESD